MKIRPPSLDAEALLASLVAHYNHDRHNLHPVPHELRHTNELLLAVETLTRVLVSAINSAFANITIDGDKIAEITTADPQLLEHASVALFEEYVRRAKAAELREIVKRVDELAAVPPITTETKSPSFVPVASSSYVAGQYPFQQTVTAAIHTLTLQPCGRCSYPDHPVYHYERECPNDPGPAHP